MSENTGATVTDSTDPTGIPVIEAPPASARHRESHQSRRPRWLRAPAWLWPRSRRRRLVVVTLAVVVGLFSTGTIVGYALTSRLQGKVGRIHGAFDGLDERNRPQAMKATGMNFLVAGSDSRDEIPTTGRDAAGRAFIPGYQRSDTLMLVHLAEDRKSAAVMSLPRDAWVDVPGRGMDKINSAYSFGGPALMVATVEKLTNVRIDHVAAIDFHGFKEIVDSIGGVDVRVAKDTSDGGGYWFHAGVNHLDGDEALAYVRQRHNLPGDDLDRERRQQNLIRAVMAKTATLDPLGHPVALYRLLDAGTRAFSVDDTLTDANLRSLALSAFGMPGSAVSFVSAPTRGGGMEGAQSVIRLDEARCGELWNAVRTDAMADYIAHHHEDLLSGTPN